MLTRTWLFYVASSSLGSLLLLVACRGDGPVGPQVPPRVVITGGDQSLVSGASVQLAAVYSDARGRPVAGATFSWSSSDQSVASVSATGVVTGALVGTATITATSNATSGTATMTVTAGTPAGMTFRVRPGGASAGVALSTQPVIELRDVRGNLASTTASVVTASIASGGGTLIGEVSVTSSGGIATFTTLAIGGTIGPRTLNFSAPGLPPLTTDEINLLSGPASSLGFRIQPAGGGLNSAFTAQPVIEVRDAYANVVTSSAATVMAAITAGGGTLTGNSAVAAAGVATFAGLGITGNPGPRTLAFSTAGLPPLTLTTTPCDLTRPPTVGLSQTARALTLYTGTPAVSDTVAILDRTGSCTALAGLTVTTAFPATSGWLASTIRNPASLILTFTPGQLGSGAYTASATVSSTNGGSVVLPVTMTLRRPFIISYGTPEERVNQLDPNQTLAPTIVVRDTSGSVVILPVTVTSRAPSIVGASSTGMVTARREGQGWVVARLVGENNVSDSVFVNVTRGPGPVLRTDLRRLEYDRNNTFAVDVQIDTRGAMVAGAQVVFTWPALNDTPGTLTMTSFTEGTAGNPQITIDQNRGTARISIASATGIGGVITLGRFNFTASVSGSGQMTTRFIELVGVDQASLLENASSLQYPIVVR
ncbi:MAG: Ig-like domain-containing protein [Gemmatimonadaceae bacterium]